MKRYSAIWWSAILPTSVIVGGPTFLLTGYFSGWDFLERVAVVVVLTLVVDLAIAAWMERVAPTRVSIGPGERVLNSEFAAEKAKVVDGFGSSAHGQVSIRGETWSAIRLPDDTGILSAGMVVSVVDRNGLSLIVTTTSD